MDVKKSIEATIKRFEKYDDEEFIYKSFENNFSTFDSVYSFTNENLSDYYKKLNYTGRILSVASSGDHMLHSVLGGAKEITLFDINALTIYYVDLKVAAIKALSIQEFKEYFIDDDFLHYPSLKYKIFKKLRSCLNADAFEYWNALYENRHGHFKVSDIDVMFNLGAYFSAYNCAYSNMKMYNKLSKLLNYIDLEFINTDIFDLEKKINGMYSSMIFSNISNYFDKKEKVRYLKYIKENLTNHLIYDGVIQYSYNFYDICKCKYNELGFSNIYLGKDSVEVYTKKRIK